MFSLFLLLFGAFSFIERVRHIPILHWLFEFLIVSIIYLTFNKDFPISFVYTIISGGSITSVTYTFSADGLCGSHCYHHTRGTGHNSTFRCNWTLFACKVTYLNIYVAKHFLNICLFFDKYFQFDITKRIGTVFTVSFLLLFQAMYLIWTYLATSNVIVQYSFVSVIVLVICLVESLGFN